MDYLFHIHKNSNLSHIQKLNLSPSHPLSEEDEISTSLSTTSPPENVHGDSQYQKKTVLYNSTLFSAKGNCCFTI